MNLKNFYITSLLLVFFFLFQGTALAAAPVGEEKKSEVLKFAREAYQKIKADKALSPQQRLYQLSMPLLAMATFKELGDYEQIRGDMQELLSNESTQSQIEKPWQLWMLGRMALASKLAGDSEQLKQLKEQLTTQLFSTENKDLITGWAFAYLASLDEESYQKCREKLDEYQQLEKDQYTKHPEKEASNYVWTLVMDLYASASSGKEDYVRFLTELTELTEQKSLEDTSLLVPESDYRQWLVSLERYSFALMKDTNSLNELKALNKPEIDSFDSMLGWANTLTMPSNSTSSPALDVF